MQKWSIRLELDHAGTSSLPESTTTNGVNILHCPFLPSRPDPDFYDLPLPDLNSIAVVGIDDRYLHRCWRSGSGGRTIIVTFKVTRIGLSLLGF
ncbi:unnamed protein product [Lactuca virosa]|uniref:Uncharacterized protein n=1 Tax=Lactuca virosa TaxID=75947 RepID=A0AAU9N061_9ASTR|nr:unnamed protein product [Lactuca virosa]